MACLRLWQACVVCTLFVVLIQQFLTTFVIENSPGRFYAVDVLKALLAYIVVNYDIKADNAISGKVMIRKRMSASET